MKVKVGSTEWVVMNALRRVETERTGPSFWLLLVVAVGCYFAGTASSFPRSHVSPGQVLPAPVIERLAFASPAIEAGWEGIMAQCIADADESPDLR